MKPVLNFRNTQLPQRSSRWLASPLSSCLVAASAPRSTVSLARSTPAAPLRKRRIKHAGSDRYVLLPAGGPSLDHRGEDRSIGKFQLNLVSRLPSGGAPCEA